MGSAEMAKGAVQTNAKAIRCNRLEIGILVTIAATDQWIDDALP
jgi:hypothetical protein